MSLGAVMTEVFLDVPTDSLPRAALELTEGRLAMTGRSERKRANPNSGRIEIICFDGRRQAQFADSLGRTQQPILEASNRSRSRRWREG
jgi:hypothetical protein